MTEEDFSLPPGIYEVVCIIESLKNILSSKLLLDIIVDDITMRPTLTLETQKDDERILYEKSVFASYRIYGNCVCRRILRKW